MKHVLSGWFLAKRTKNKLWDIHWDPDDTQNKNPMSDTQLANRKYATSAWQHSTIHKGQDKGDNHRIRVGNFTASSILTKFSAFRLSSLRPHERKFKRLTLCQWRGRENCCVDEAQKTGSRILRGRETCSDSKVGCCYCVTVSRSRNGIHWELPSFWCMIVVPVSVIILILEKMVLPFDSYS